MKGRRQGSFSDGGLRSRRRVQVSVASWDEESRKRRRCLTVGGEGEDSGCQIGSPRLWNLHHTLTHEINETLDCVRGGEEDVEKTSSAAQPRMAAKKGLMPSGGP